MQTDYEKNIVFYRRAEIRWKWGYHNVCFSNPYADEHLMYNIFRGLFVLEVKETDSQKLFPIAVVNFGKSLFIAGSKAFQ